MQRQTPQTNSSDPALLPELPTDYKVLVRFRGFIISFINPGEAAWVGALSNTISSCHRPNIRVYKLNLPSAEFPHGSSVDITPVDLDPNVDITLTADPVGTGIEVFKTDHVPIFNRFDERHNSKKDFRWFINLNEIHGEQIGTVPTMLSPKFHINKGLFYTSERSDGELRIDNPTGPTPNRPYGRFAVEISARLYLRDTGSYATCVGNVPLFPPIRNEDRGFKYEVVYDCSCRINEDSLTSDFGLIYQAITVSDPSKKLEMVPDDKVERVSPEVYCMGGTFP